MAGPVALAEALAPLRRPVEPHVVMQVNEYDVRVAKVAGEHVWHAHHDTDEFLLVLDGELTIALEEPSGGRTVVLPTGSVFVVPRGTRHRPSSPAGASILMLEPSGTLSTGDAVDLPGHVDSTTGHALDRPAKRTRGRPQLERWPGGVRARRGSSSCLPQR